MTDEQLPHFVSLSHAWEYIQQNKSNRDKLSATDEDGNTLMHLYPETVFRLKDLGVDVNCLNQVGETPLMTAVRKGKTAYELLDLTDSSLINRRYQSGDTLLTMYLKTERISSWSHQFIRQLCQKGIDVNLPDGDGRLPFSFCLKKVEFSSRPMYFMNQLDIMDTLVLYGAEIQDFFGKQSYLNERLKRTVLEDTTDLIRLIETTKNQDLFLPDEGGNTALHAYAMSPRCDSGLFHALLKRLDINTKNHSGETPLMARLQVERFCQTKGLVEQLIRYSDVNLTDAEGRTPMHVAVKNIHDNACQYVLALLAQGADVSKKDNQGQKPVDVALSLSVKALLLTFEQLSQAEQEQMRMVYHDMVFENKVKPITRHPTTIRVHDTIRQNNR